MLPALGQPEIVGCDVLVVVVLGAVVVVDGFVVVVVGRLVVVVVGGFVVVVLGAAPSSCWSHSRWSSCSSGSAGGCRTTGRRAEFEASATSCGHFHEAAATAS